jgi:cellulose 1,4-beta-cellobiosidase
MESNLAAIRKLNQQNPSQPTAAQFVVYNLPDRDCSASSSAGELSVSLLRDQICGLFVHQLT